MADPIQNAADALRAQLEERVTALKATAEMAEVLRLRTALNAVEDVLKQRRTTLAEAFGLDDSTEETADRPKLMPWEFTGFGALESAKKYLKKVGEPRPISEIMAAIKGHGGDPGREEDLRISLSRSTFDVVKVNDDTYGLLEFFPHMRRGSKKRKAIPVSLTDFAELDQGDAGEDEPEIEDGEPDGEGGAEA